MSILVEPNTSAIFVQIRKKPGFPFLSPSGNPRQLMGNKVNHIISLGVALRIRIRTESDSKFGGL
jgi:hypothetical protein